MKNLKVLSLVAVLAAAAVSNAAPSILFFTDNTIDQPNVNTALNNLGYSYTEVNDTGSFNADLSSQSWNLVIFDDTDYYQDQSGLDAYVAAGGHAIYCDWTRNNTTAALFDAQFDGNYDFNSVNGSGMGPFAGTTDPVQMNDTVWGIYTTGLTTLAGGVGYGDTGLGDNAIVMGNGGKTYVNGFLDDIGGSSAVTIYQNEINGSLSATSTPSPAAVLPFAAGMIGFVRRRIKKS
jgi:hypothetical protein